jgi:transcriptional regulator with XRE-family HTH domain
MTMHAESGSVARMTTMIQRHAEIPVETLGQRLERARKAVGIGVGQMAEILDVSRSMVSRYESGAETPRRMVLLAYALICGVPIAWVETGAGGDDDHWLQHFGVTERAPRRRGRVIQGYPHLLVVAA